jgi:hypothetical protein
LNKALPARRTRFGDAVVAAALLLPVSPSYSQPPLSIGAPPLRLVFVLSATSTVPVAITSSPLRLAFAPSDHALSVAAPTLKLVFLPSAAGTGAAMQIEAPWLRLIFQAP